MDEIVWAKVSGHPWWPAYVNLGALRSWLSMTMLMMRKGGRRRGTKWFSSGIHLGKCYFYEF